MGKTLLILALGFSALFGTMALNMSRRSLDSSQQAANQYANTVARNAATSGIYMALSRLYRNTAWRSGYQNLNLGGGTLNVEVQDHNNDPTLSTMELRVVSTATYLNATKTIQVMLGVPPDLADLAIFVTDTIVDVTALNESRVPDPTLAIQNAPEMLPFDKTSLVALATAQNHVINGNFTAPDNWPTNDPTKDFYWDASHDIPNVTHVKGNLTVNGSTQIYGIFVVEGNATLQGNSRLDGVLYLPNPGTIVIHGGGDPKESTITGGVFANAAMYGTGNHITVEYKQEFMAIFGEFQLAKNMFMVSWVESPSSN